MWNFFRILHVNMRQNGLQIFKVLEQNASATLLNEHVVIFGNTKLFKNTFGGFQKNFRTKKIEMFIV